MYRVVVQMKDRFGFMLGSGIMLFFGFQSLINLAAMTRLAPLTGIPLPFISYGGTSLLISFCFVGIMISLARQESPAEKPHFIVKAFRSGSMPLKNFKFMGKRKK
jgi:cell division protein FtsW